MTVTAYAPDAYLVAGNTIIGIAPAIADIDNPTVAELTTGGALQIQCATENFNISTNVNKQSRKMICDAVAKERVGSRQYQADDLTLMAGDLQEANAAIDLLAVDSIVYLWTRPSKADSAPVAAGDKVLVAKVSVDAVDLAAVTNGDGEEFRIVVKFSAQDRTQLFGTVKA